MDISKFDLRMPVPEKGAGFVAGKFLVAYQQRKFITAMFLQFFLWAVGYDLCHYICVLHWEYMMIFNYPIL